MIVSLPFLFVTLLIYVAIQDLRNLHGKIVICYVLVLISAFISLPAIQLQIVDKPKILCKFFGYWFYYSIISAFFWINVMCYDIFSNLATGRLRRSKNYTEERRFIKYALYAFLSPALLLGVAILMDSLQIPVHFKPQFGKETCYLNSMFVIRMIRNI